MKTAIFLPALLISTSFTLSAEPLTQQQIDMTVEFSVNSMKADGTFKEMSSCLNTSEIKAEAAFGDVMAACLKLDNGAENDDQLTACLLSKYAAEFGVSEEQMLLCADELEEDENSEIDSEDEY